MQHARIAAVTRRRQETVRKVAGDRVQETDRDRDECVILQRAVNKTARIWIVEHRVSWESSAV